MTDAPRIDVSATATAGEASRIDYVEQLSADLAFYLFESRAPRQAVRVLVERSLPLPGGRLTVAIIGSSHFLEIEAGDSVLCELVACLRPGLGEASHHLAAGAGRGWAYRVHRGRLSYQFESWRRDYAESEFAAETARLASAANSRLQFVFPGPGGSGGAVTCLEWQLEGRRATVATHHTFPGELAVVHTHSVIDVAEEGAST